MKIQDIIDTVKKNCKGYGIIDDSKARDKVLWGSTDKECTGIVTTIYPSVEVIRKAYELGANLIISHESCFWNHGDHTDWLKDNVSFQMKSALLDEYGITVWRDHDYIHSKILYHGKYVDGIYYGLATELGWLDYVVEDAAKPNMFVIPETPAMDVAKHFMNVLGLKGMKTMGDLTGTSRKVMFAFHLIGVKDNEILREIEEKNVDTVLTMEITDYTTAIYVRDSAQLGREKRIFNPGHFNLEEPGMKWFGEVYLNELIPEVKSTFVKAGDSYTMLINE